MQGKNNNIIAIVSLAHLVQDTYSAFLYIARKIPSLFNPFFGLLAERSDARYFVILSPAFTVVVMSLLGVANSYTMLLILLFIAGITSTLFHMPSPGMIKASAEINLDAV